MTKNYTVEKYQTREDWLNARGIGGSSVAAIVGLSPWLTKLELYNALVNPTERIDDDTEAKARGRAAEPLIRAWWALRHPDMKMREPDGYEMYRRKDIPLMTATIDGEVTDKDGRLGIWECKSHEVRSAEDLAEWTGKWPLYYLCQTYDYLLVRNDCDFLELTVALDFYDFSGGEVRLTKTEIRNEHIERSDIEKELSWLEREVKDFCLSVENRIPPDGEIKF